VMNTSKDATPTRTEDEAARAGWLYYIAGMTQDGIAAELGVSRQRVQRLVSRAMSDGLIHVRLEHPLASCMALEAQMVQRFGLRRCRVAPSLPHDMDQTPSIAPLAAAEIERVLRRDTPLVVALGTGRTMRAAIDELSLMVCDHHRIVSLNGTIGRDGAATSHDVIMRIAEMVQAPHYPMPVPVICDSAEERAEFHALRPVRCVAELARDADETFVGVGHMGADAPLRADGLITEAELAQLMSQDAAGEVAGWVFDGAGQYLDLPHNARVGGVRVTAKSSAGVTCIAAGPKKMVALHAALKGNLINGLVTDERTAEQLVTSR